MGSVVVADLVASEARRAPASGRVSARDERVQRPLSTLRRLIIVQGGLITSTGVVLVVLVLVFVVPGAVF